jgi:hypothetical protein
MRLNSEKTPAAGEKFGGSRYGHAGVQVGSREGVIGPCESREILLITQKYTVETIGEQAPRLLQPADSQTVRPMTIGSAVGLVPLNNKP